MTSAQVAPEHGTAARGRFRADLVYVGWQWLPGTDPGPPPSPPQDAEPDVLDPDWLAAQRREHARLTRPARLITLTAGAVAVAVAGLWLSGRLPAGLTVLSGAAAGAVGADGCVRLWRARRALAGQLLAEERRVAAFRAVQRAEQAEQQQEHARRVRDWRQRSAAFARRPRWYPVTLPSGVRRVDVVGGTLAGWSALLTLMAAARLAAGGEVTVIDLTEGGVASDVLAVARHQGAEPLTWLLPADLPRLELGADFNHDLLADILARTAAAAAGPGAEDGSMRDAGLDAALLRRVLAALGDGATLAQLTAALRALGQIGGPADHLASAELTPAQLTRLGALAGRGAGEILIDRAWTLEARLQPLSALASAPASRPASALRVAWLDGSAAPLAAAGIAAYLVIALAEALRRSRPAAPWQQTVFVFGADRLPVDVLDRLCDAAEISSTGLVLGYRSVRPHVRDRLGRGDSAVAFMRLGNAADARLAAEQIGTEQRFVLSQLTDSVGASVTGTAGGSYTSTTGTSDSVGDSRSATWTAGRSRGRGRSRAPGLAPFTGAGGSASRDESVSAALSDSRSVTAAINAGTSWGLSTSRAVGTTGSVTVAAQRAREFIVEPHELQQLPHSAVVLCYPAPGGRQVVLADANPAIMTLPTATLSVPGPAG